MDSTNVLSISMSILQYYFFLYIETEYFLAAIHLHLIEDAESAEKMIIRRSSFNNLNVEYLAVNADLKLS